MSEDLWALRRWLDERQGLAHSSRALGYKRLFKAHGSDVWCLTLSPTGEWIQIEKSEDGQEMSCIGDPQVGPDAGGEVPKEVRNWINSHVPGTFDPNWNIGDLDYFPDYDYQDQYEGMGHDVGDF